MRTVKILSMSALLWMALSGVWGAFCYQTTEKQDKAEVARTLQVTADLVNSQLSNQIRDLKGRAQLLLETAKMGESPMKTAKDLLDHSPGLLALRLYTSRLRMVGLKARTDWRMDFLLTRNKDQQDRLGSADLETIDRRLPVQPESIGEFTATFLENNLVRVSWPVDKNTVIVAETQAQWWEKTVSDLIPKDQEYFWIGPEAKPYLPLARAGEDLKHLPLIQEAFKTPQGFTQYHWLPGSPLLTATWRTSTGFPGTLVVQSGTSSRRAVIFQRSRDAIVLGSGLLMIAILYATVIGGAFQRERSAPAPHGESVDTRPGQQLRLLKKIGGAKSDSDQNVKRLRRLPRLRP
jgi:hypothetical protein